MAPGSPAFEVSVVDDPVSVCAQAMVSAARGRRGAHIALSGGSSPRAVYELAAHAPDAFEHVTFWFGDDRCVPPTDEDSNFRMATETLLDPLERAGVRPVCHRIPDEGGPEVAALAYERLLREAGPPTFDLILLGIGPDGHTLSLFPGQPSVSERDRLVVGVPEAGMEPYVPRVSMTLPALALATKVILLAIGAAKAPALARAFGHDAAPSTDVPASLVPGAVVPGALTLLLDEPAAELL